MWNVECREWEDKHKCPLLWPNISLFDIMFDLVEWSLILFGKTELFGQNLWNILFVKHVWDRLAKQYSINM